MIVVTGATGKLGRLIVNELLRIVPASLVAASARDPGKAGGLAARGARLRQGDYEDPASLQQAFQGAEQVLIVSSNARASGGDPLAQHRAAIAAARSVGARRLVYTSHMGASPTSAFSPMHDHAATETLLADSGLAWTALRNGFYASTVPQLVGDAAATGRLVAPVDGKVAWTAHADLAACAARILADEGRFDGPTPPLTAAEASDLADVAAVLSRLAGRHVDREVVTDEEQAARLKGHGLPRAMIEMTMGIYRAARAGEFARTDPTLARLIGRQPATIVEELARALEAPKAGGDQRHQSV